MPAPQISEDIRIRNGVFTRGRFEVAYSDPISIRFICSSTGNSDPDVRFSVNWGDGEQELISGFLVGQEVQMEHVYENSGDYNISVVAVNSDGVFSLKRTAAIRTAIIAERKKDLSRWIGIALPRKDLDISVQSLQDSYPSVSYTLAFPASEGDFEVILNAVSVSDLVEAEYTISQQGKLYSSGRVLKAEGNKLTLDTALGTSYDSKAEFEIHSRSISGGVIRARSTDYSWLFQTSTDEELVRSSFIVNLSVRKGERVMLPTFGSNLHLIPFEQNDLYTRQLLQLEVVAPIVMWEPRAEISQVSINSSTDNEVELSMSYRYSGGSQDIPFTALIPLRTPEAAEVSQR
jgi:phage baseplate assembly protein W